MTAHHITSHHTSHHITWQNMTSHDMTWHHITWHDITSHDMTSHNQPHYLTSRQLTSGRITSSHLATNYITSSHLATNHMTPYSYHITSQRITSPPPTHHGNTRSTARRNGWGLVHAKNSVWAARWLVALRAVYRQILSLAYRPLALPTPARPGTTGAENLIVQETYSCGQGFNRSYNAAASSQKTQFDMWSQTSTKHLEYTRGTAHDPTSKLKSTGEKRQFGYDGGSDEEVCQNESGVPTHPLHFSTAYMHSVCQTDLGSNQSNSGAKFYLGG